MVHTMHMKRTNLVLPEGLLDEVVRISGIKTYSGAVKLALEAYVQRARARQILHLQGSGLWHGSVAEMRDDAPPDPMPGESS